MVKYADLSLDTKIRSLLSASGRSDKKSRSDESAVTTMAESTYDNPTFVSSGAGAKTGNKYVMNEDKSTTSSGYSKTVLIILVIAIIAVAALAITGIVLYSTIDSNDTAEDDCTNGCLIFEDTFDTFRFDVWQHEITAWGGGNAEFQYYINNRSNSYVRDNILYIKPTLTLDKFWNVESDLYNGTLDLWGAYPANQCTGNAWGGCSRSGDGNNIVNPIQSAKLRMVNSLSFTYGKVEIEAKMPTGDWLWPAIWMMPKYNEYGDWPASGEIDIVECRGNRNLRAPEGHSVGIDNMGATMHWGPYYPYNGYEKTHGDKTLTSGTFGSDFHKYGIEWTEDNIQFFVDDELVLVADPGDDGFYKFGGWHESIPDCDNPWVNSPNKMAPFDKEFYLIFNVAVGGTNGYF
ncbi:beta-1,3-glucan-binding protein-like [Ptychodera flava]|uniref:beta-1,3-glucan-binding protein-like n=1 Tax=Ptychodera flava TaxID=63121 RepID=UPI00396A057B